MRNRLTYFRPLLDYLGVLLGIFGLLLLVPLLVQMAFPSRGAGQAPSHAFWIPAAVALVLGVVLKRNLEFPPLDNRRAMMLCALGWIVVSAVGALPFVLAGEAMTEAVGRPVGYLDAYFETVSGFTTTGITMFSGLDEVPTSIIFWRGFTQWLGGLGILTFFLAVIFTGGSSAHRLYSAESHKIFAKRPEPGLLKTLRILWTIYGGFTVLIAGALWLEGVSPFDAICHAMTCISTGGYSPYDASIAHYAAAGHPRAVLIEYTVTFGMLLGGINFLVHYRVIRGGIKALWEGLEMRLWWAIVFGATAVVMVDHFRQFWPAAEGWATLHDVFRTSLFQVVALVTTTGFGTEDIATDYFPAAAKQMFLVLMVVGGCVGSTGGGFKVLRIGVLVKMVGRQLKRLLYGPAAVHPVVVDGDPMPAEELRRIAALFFAWTGLLVFGGLVTALFSNHGTLASASGMFSALGNIGPCYISVADLARLNPIVKIVYIFGMLAGRLEIVPLLILFSRRTWR